MKKRIPATLTITLIILSLCLSACHAKYTTPKQDDSSQAEASANPKITEETDEYPLFYGNDPLLGYQFYTVDKNGNKKCNVSEKTQAILEQNNIDLEQLDIYTCYLINSILFIEGYSKEESDAFFYALDINNNRLEKITNSTLVDYIDYYNGKLYIGFYDPEAKNSEYAYTISDDFSFTPEETDHQKVLDYIGGYTADGYKIGYEIEKTPNCTYRMEGIGFSISRAFDEAGYVLASRYENMKKEFIRIFPDGTNAEIKELKAIDAKPLYYDNNTIILAAEAIINLRDAKEIYTLDLKSGTLEHITDLGEIIQLADNKVFHRKDDSLYAFDLEEKTDSLIYKFEKITGVNVDLYDRYQIINGNIFVSDFKDAELKWFRLTGCEEGASAVDIDCPIKTISAYKIGTVTAYSSNYKCPFCGTKMIESNYELFRLNDGYSEHTEEINKKLKEKMDYFLNHTEDDTPNIEITDDSCCEYHSDPNFTERFFREKTVTEANIYNSRFLTVNMYYYWFGGGPHGLYHTDIYVFDLTTGEELGIINFYPGTESEFAALVAKNFNKEYPAYPWHYEDNTEPSSDDEKRDLGYFDSTNIRYYNDHITYCFNIYEMGAYCDGEYLVDITYEELNGNKELTRVR